MNSKQCLIGIGHPFRGDDGLGPYVIDLLRSKVPKTVDLYQDPGDMVRLLEWFELYQEVYLVDAMSTGDCPAGTLFNFEMSSNKLVAEKMNTSSHILNLKQTVELAHTLGIHPKVCRCFGLEAQSFEPSTQLSKPLLDNLPLLCDTILQALKE